MTTPIDETHRTVHKVVLQSLMKSSVSPINRGIFLDLLCTKLVLVMPYIMFTFLKSCLSYLKISNDVRGISEPKFKYDWNVRSERQGLCQICMTSYIHKVWPTLYLYYVVGVCHWNDKWKKIAKHWFCISYSTTFESFMANPSALVTLYLTKT